MHGMGRVWAKIRIGQRPIFEKCVLTSLARKMPKNVCHSAMHPRFSFSSPFSFTLGILGEAGVFPVSFIHVFGCWLHFSHGWEVVFVVLGIGLFFLTIWELLVHFPFTILSDPPHAQQAGSHLLLLPTIPGIVVNSFESHFGHDRAKNDSGIVSLFKL